MVATNTRTCEHIQYTYTHIMMCTVYLIYTHIYIYVYIYIFTYTFMPRLNWQAVASFAGRPKDRCALSAWSSVFCQKLGLRAPGQMLLQHIITAEAAAGENSRKSTSSC